MCITVFRFYLPRLRFFFICVFPRGKKEVSTFFIKAVYMFLHGCQFFFCIFIHSVENKKVCPISSPAVENFLKK